MSLTYTDLLQKFKQYLQFEKRYSQHTVTAYETDLIQFFDFLVVQYGTPPIDEVIPAFIKSWLVTMKDSRQEVSNKTIRRKISSLTSFFKFLLRTSVISKTPMWSVVAPKSGRRLPVYLTEEATTQMQAITFADDWDGRTDALMLSILYQTGIRRSELIGLKLRHVDKGNGQIKVLGKGNKERLVPVSTELMQAIEKYQQEIEKEFQETVDEHLLVNERGGQLKPRDVYRRLQQYIGMVSTAERKGPHVLRHTFATQLMNQGADINAVKLLLGHSTLAATQVYTHNNIEQLQKIYRQAHPRGSESS